MLTTVDSNSSQGWECDDWTCNGYLYDDNPIQYEQCTKDSTLWHEIIECTYCSNCSNVTMLNDTYNICSCDTDSNCRLATIASVSIAAANSTIWWIIALCAGGSLAIFFFCAIIIYIVLAAKNDEELNLKDLLERQKYVATPVYEQDDDFFTNTEITENNESGESDENNENTTKQRPTLAIQIEDFDAISVLCPILTELNDYNVIFPQSYNDIDIYTKCVVVGYTRDIIKTVTRCNTDIIRLIALYFFNNTVNFSTINKDFIMSSNGFYYGYHEWSVRVLKPSVRRHEIGIVSILNPYTTIGSRTLEGTDMSMCDMEEFGARTVYGTDCQTFYYASYNENNFERCYKELHIFHRYRYWNEGDVIRIVLDLYKGNITFYLNDRKIRKAIRIQKNKVYYPIISYFGRFRCELVHYK